MTKKIEELKSELQNIEKQLLDPNIHSDLEKSKSLNKKYNKLKQIIDLADEYSAVQSDLEAAKEFAKTDASFSGEVDALEAKKAKLKDKLDEALTPKDPNNSRDVILEIKAGAGGDEAGLFAAELMKMYEKYVATQSNWKWSVIENDITGVGGIKNAQVSITSDDYNNGVWGKLKYEAGVHRVQRVPTTESQGRIHTSAVGVLVMPQIEDESEIDILPTDIRVDVYRSSGPGGQGVNTTDSAVRITHIPTGLVVTSQNQRSQIQNKEQALKVLKARLLEQKISDQAQNDSEMRKSQVRTADRSEKIRTYNFPENRISDHRTGYKAYNLSQVLSEGLIEPIIESCISLENSKNAE